LPCRLPPPSGGVSPQGKRRQLKNTLAPLKAKRKKLGTSVCRAARGGTASAAPAFAWKGTGQTKHGDTRQETGENNKRGSERAQGHGRGVRGARSTSHHITPEAAAAP